MTASRKVRVKRPTKAEAEATEQVREFLDISDIAGYMRGEIKPPDMLLADWLQKGVLHWMQGEPEDGKSWVALWCAVQLLQKNDEARVLLMDGEMGARSVGERLHALGLDPDVAHARVTHVNLSAVSQDKWSEFNVWAAAMRFTLVIWDPIAHHLAGAALNEDSNSDVQRWLAQVVNPVLNTGATVIGIDHVPKNGDNRGYARGASAKKARSRLVYEFDKKSDFSRSVLGEVMVELVKNSDAAEIPKERLIVLGGEPNTGRFVMRVAEREPVVTVDRKRDDARARVDAAVAILEAKPPGTKMASKALAELIGGKPAKTIEALREAATTAGGRLNVHVEERGTRNITRFSLRTDKGLRGPGLGTHG